MQQQVQQLVNQLLAMPEKEGLDWFNTWDPVWQDAVKKRLHQMFPMESFSPHEKQVHIKNSIAKNIIVFGGNRSGKTEINVHDFMQMLDGSHPCRWYHPRPDGQNLLIWVTAESKAVFKDTLQKKFKYFGLEKWFRQNPSKFQSGWIHIYLSIPNKRFSNQLPDGCLKVDITVKTYDQDPDTFESASVDGVLADEEPPEEIFNALQTRLLDARSWNNGWFQCALTPTKGKGWTVEKYWKEKQEGLLDEGTFVIQMSTYDNQHNLGGEKAVQALADTFEPHERQARIHGVPTAKYGKVLDKYVDAMFPNGHLLLPHKPDWKKCAYYESIDFGYAAPCSIGLHAVYPEGYSIRFDEIYVRQFTVPEIKSALWHKRKYYNIQESAETVLDQDCFKRMKDGGISIAEQFSSKEANVWIGKGQEPTKAFIHNLRKKLTLGKITQSEYDLEISKIRKREGFISFPIYPVKSNSVRDQGWEKFNHKLLFDPVEGRPNYFVTTNCIEFRKEARMAKWKEGRFGQVGKGITGSDHALDEARYHIMSDPIYRDVLSYNKSRRVGGKKRVRKY